MPEVVRRGRSAENSQRQEKRSVVVDGVAKLRAEGKVSLFGSLIANPKGTKFETQNDGEQIMLLLRSHPVTNMGWVAFIFLIFPIPLFWKSFPLISSLSPVLELALTLLCYLGLALFALNKFLTWFYSVFIVTDERIIDVDFYGLLYKNVDVTQIKNIEEVNYSQAGILGNTFNFGDVVVQTASEQRTAEKSERGAAFTFESVPEPDKVAGVISELMQQEEEEQMEGRTK